MDGDKMRAIPHDYFLLANDDVRDAVRMIHVRFGMAADEGRDDRNRQHSKHDLLHEQTSEKRVFQAPYE